MKYEIFGLPLFLGPDMGEVVTCEGVAGAGAGASGRGESVGFVIVFLA
jgi:hypothetical protein